MSLHDHFLQNSALSFDGKIFQQRDFSGADSFEREYNVLREREGRKYTDEVVRRLPEFEGTGTLHREWKLRATSLRWMLPYLRNRSPRNILEIGCGNGWLSCRLAQSLGAEVCGIDVNESELLQGATVFCDQPRLNFIYGDVLHLDFAPLHFDVILLAASIAYFSDIHTLIRTLIHHLSESGEIYIVDSPLYRSRSEREEARTRTAAHFAGMDIPQMANRYFHHSLEDLDTYNPHVQFDPRSAISRVRRLVLPFSQPAFPWIIIRAQQP